MNDKTYSTTTPAHACNCIGPQNGQPLCPCRMRNVQVRNGRYVEVIDHGPAPESAQIVSEMFVWGKLE